MHVEDALENLLILKHAKGLFTRVQKDDWKADFIENVAAYTRSGKPLSTMQSKMVLQIIQQVATVICEPSFGAKMFDVDAVNELIRNPTHRLIPYPSADIPREVRWLGDNKLGFRFKKNPTIVHDIKAVGKNAWGAPWFHRLYRVWIVPVTEKTLEPILDTIREHGFIMDDQTKTYLETAVEQSKEKSAVLYDEELGLFVAQINNNDLASWWMEMVVGANVE